MAKEASRGPENTVAPGDAHTLDARALRGIAHPLRMRLLRELREEGPATAGQLAARLGESSDTVDHHLGRLAAYGFVTADHVADTDAHLSAEPSRDGAPEPDAGSSRNGGAGRGDGAAATEPRWTASYRRVGMDRGPTLEHPDPDVLDEGGLLVHELATAHAQELGTWLGTLHDWPEPWSTAWDLSDVTLRLTPARAHELRQKLHDLIDSYRTDSYRTPDPGAPDRDHIAPPEHDNSPETASFRLHLHAFPRATSATRDPPEHF